MNHPPPAAPDPRPTRAFLLGRAVQSVVLGLALAAIIAQLVRSSTELAFRYGGF